MARARQIGAALPSPTMSANVTPCASETRRKMAADPNYGAVTLRYDSQGRQVDEAGNIVDPYAAQLQALQAAQPAVQSWSYADWGQYGVLPTVFNAQGQAVQVWDGQQWLQVAN